MTKSVDVFVDGLYVRTFSEADHGADYEELARQFASAKDRNGEVRPSADHEPITDPERLLPAGEVESAPIVPGGEDELTEEESEEVSSDESEPEVESPTYPDGPKESSDEETSPETTTESDPSTEDETVE